MGHPSFGPMWPSSNPNIVTLVRADGLRIPLHRELLELTKMLMDLTELNGYNIKPGETWGYANRNISGTNSPSNHSQGTADDLNAPANPYASADWHRRNARGTFPFGLRIVCDIPEAVLRLWESHGYRLGAKYITKPDPMHVEFMGTVDDARKYTARLKAWFIKTSQEGEWNMAAEEKLDQLIVVTKEQTETIRRQSRLTRKENLKRELREARRNEFNTDEIIAAIDKIPDEEDDGQVLTDPVEPEPG